jgi:hypothetical protein
MREKFLEYLSNVERQMSEDRREQIVHFAETKLTDFLRQFIDSAYPGLYARIDRKFYVDVENKMQVSAKMRQVAEMNSMYGLSIMHYKNFLGSALFRGNDRPLLAPEEKKVPKAVASPEEINKQPDPLLPDQEEPTTKEGKSQQVNITRYERDAEDRKKALERDNYECQVCHINFESVYGEIGRGYIEVHHLYPVCNMGEDYQFDALDPERGLVCLCSNCHSMIHRGGHYEERDGKRVMIPMNLQDLQLLYAKLNPKN